MLRAVSYEYIIIDVISSFLFVVSVMLRVVGVVDVVDVRVEAVVLVCRIRHLPDSTVGLDHAVLAVHDIALAVLRLMLVVASVRVFYSVLVRVVRWCLQETRPSVNNQHDIGCIIIVVGLGGQVRNCSSPVDFAISEWIF